jgi:hypothetical protein
VGTVEDLISALRATCAGVPDKRRGKNIQYLMADIGMAAFSVFFMPDRHGEPFADYSAGLIGPGLTRSCSFRSARFSANEATFE